MFIEVCHNILFGSVGVCVHSVFGSISYQLWAGAASVAPKTLPSEPRYPELIVYNWQLNFVDGVASAQVCAARQFRFASHNSMQAASVSPTVGTPSLALSAPFTYMFWVLFQIIPAVEVIRAPAVLHASVVAPVAGHAYVEVYCIFGNPSSIPMSLDSLVI